MKKEIKIENKKINYTLKTSKKARCMRLAVYNDGSCTVTKPFGLNESLVEKFIREKSDWIISKMDYFKRFKGSYFIQGSRKDYLKHKENARIFIESRVDHYCKLYGLNSQRISIRNQKTRWGSCSKSGNLNFNYRILFLPNDLADYIIVHEVCHLQEFNHSLKFWNLVSKAIPDYKEIRKKLKSGNIGVR